MALLQIAEPDAPPVPRVQRLAVGIDLGTTNSLVATVRNGFPVVLPDERGHPLLPSIVHYGESGVDVGHAAQLVQARDPQNTIVSVKRLMGRGLADLPDQSFLKVNALSAVLRLAPGDAAAARDMAVVFARIGARLDRALVLRSSPGTPSSG